MATTAPDHEIPLELKEQIVRIDKMIAETQKTQAEIVKITRENHFAIWQVVATVVGAAAAFTAAGAALAKLFGV